MRLRLQPGSVVSLIFGFGFVIAGVYGYSHTGDYFARAREASAVVIDVVYETGTMQKGRVHPVVRFTTAEGIEVVGTSQKHHKVRPGEKLKVVYDARNPQDIEIGTLAQAQKRRAFLSGFAILFGLALGFGAVLHDSKLLRVKTAES